MAPSVTLQAIAVVAAATVTSTMAAGTAVRGNAEGALPALAGKWSLWSPQAAQPAAVPKVSSVHLEVYYGATCPNCLNFLSESLAPFVEAKLPGESVQLTMLPWVSGNHDAKYCEMDRKCAFALPPICAFQAAQAVSRPAPIDAAPLRAASRFALCELEHTAFGAVLEYTPDTNRQCAEQAGLAWEGPQGLRQCAEGQGVYDIMNGAAFQGAMQSADARLSKVQDQAAPFVFLNGEVLVCPTADWCSAIRTPEGDRPLEKPGNLLYVVCNLLDSEPEVCKGLPAPQQPKMVAQPMACENCDEVSTFRWHDDRSTNWGRRMPVAVAGVATCVMLAAAVMARAFWRRARAYRTLEPAALLPPADEESADGARVLEVRDDGLCVE